MELFHLSSNYNEEKSEHYLELFLVDLVLLHHGKLELGLELISKTRDLGSESVAHTGGPFMSETNICFKLRKGNLSYCSVTESIILSINQKIVKEFLHLGLNFPSNLHRFALIILLKRYFHNLKVQYSVSDPTGLLQK